MKGNQGLEALAALCGGASKAEEAQSSDNTPPSPGPQSAPPKNDSVIPVLSDIPSFQKQCATLAQTCPQNPNIAAMQNTSIDPRKWHKTMPQVQASPYISTLPNVAAILSAAGAVLPQQGVSNVTTQFASTEASNALQQLAYFNLVQNQVSATNQMIQQPLQNASTPYGLDPNAAMAIVLAVQQQAQQVQQAQQQATIVGQ